jgi:hypothetical protein
MGLERVHRLLARLARLVGGGLLRQLRRGESVFLSQAAVQGQQETPRLGGELHAQPKLFRADGGCRLGARGGCRGYRVWIDHTRALSTRIAPRCSRDKSRSGSWFILTPTSRRLRAERYLERAREIAPDDHGEVSEQRGAAGGDIKDDGLHRSPFLGSAL